MLKTVQITGLAYGGSGLGRIDGKVVFVPFTAPGDVVKARIIASKKGFDEASLVEVVEPSEMRVEPPCPVFGVCGGCQVQHIRYEDQVRLKEEILEETVKRIGGIKDAVFDAPVHCPKPYNYRGRARFHVEGGLWGFFKSGTNDVVDIKACPLLEPSLNEVFGLIREAVSKSIKGHPKESDINSIEIGLSPRDSSIVALFDIRRGSSPFDWKGALGGIPGLKGFEVWEKGERGAGGAGGGKAGRAGGRRRVFSLGDPNIEYLFEDIRYSVSIGAFTQVNNYQNPALIGKVLEYAGITGGEKVIDLFSGAGNLTLPLWKAAPGRGSEVIGVEAGKEAYKDALRNALANGADTVKFVKADSAQWLTANIKRLEKGRRLIIVLDPTRGGDANVARALSTLKPQKAVYVSCAPPTLSRDLSILMGKGGGGVGGVGGAGGGGLKSVRAAFIDMFPQTYHIECVVEAGF